MNGSRFVSVNKKKRPGCGPGKKMNALIQYALAAGADRAVALSPRDIVVKAELADKCRAPGCPGYGLSKKCPPHVEGPAGMTNRLKLSQRAVVFRMDVPVADLFSDKRRLAFQQLHKIASGLERVALESGFSRARGYAGGSCRELFCHEHDDCPALSENGRCRFPSHARPSMSGFGIDVAALFETAGWTLRLAASTENKTANLCGLVLIY